MRSTLFLVKSTSLNQVRASEISRQKFGGSAFCYDGATPRLSGAHCPNGCSGRVALGIVRNFKLIGAWAKELSVD